MEKHRTRRTSNAAGGFTLIEVLIAVTLAAGLLVTVYALLNTTARSWSTSKRLVQVADERAVVEHFLRELIEQALPSRNFESASQSQGFSGAEGELRFLGTLPERAGTPGVYRIELNVVPSAAGNALELRYTPYRDSMPRHRMRMATVFDDLQSARFEYFVPSAEAGAGHWTGRWVDATRLPALVRFHWRKAGYEPIAWTVPIRAGSGGAPGL